MELLVVYSTFPDLASAKKMANELLENKLIACANIVDGGHSMYWWEGKVQEDREVYVWMKTMASKFDALKKEIIAKHPYQVPCVWAVAPGQVHGPYLSWAIDSMSSKPIR